MNNLTLNRENFVTIQGWMITDLKLKGNELIIYAVIYGFSQVEGEVFRGSLQYLANWANGTKQGVIKSLKSLESKGYIGKNERFINGVKFCEYYATKLNTPLNKVDHPIKQSLPNSIEDNIADNKGSYIYKGESGQVGGQSSGQQGGHKVDICPPSNTSNNLLSVNEVLELAKTYCRVLYDRFQRKIDEKGQVHLYDTLQNVLDEIGRYYTIEQLKELFIKASKLYCSTPNYSNLDLLWLLNNLKKIEDTPIRESTSGGDSNGGETKQKGYYDDFLDSIGRLE